MYRKDWASKWAEYTPNKVAVKEYRPARSLTYQELNNQAKALAHYFTHDMGVLKGERLMVLGEHSIEYVMLFSMTQKTGITLVPVNFRLSASEIDYLISDSEPRLLIAERKFEGVVAALKADIKVLWLEDLASQQQAHHEFEAVELVEDHPAFILYTSGSTGFPKGAIYSHKMLLWNSLNTSQSLEITPADLTINCMPPFHTGGWNVLVTPMLHRGATIGLMNKFDPDFLLELMELEKSNLFMGVPTMLKMMADSEKFKSVSLDAMRYFIVGGEALPLEVIDTWHRKGVKIRQGYGLTEVGPNLTSLHQDDAELKIGSIGKPNFYVEYKIVDEEGSRVGPDEVGEFCLKGPMVTPGYWRNEEATQKTIVDGWFHTGDLVKVDSDGYLYVVDRKKCMFISGGENVYPAEIERVLRGLYGVDEAAVIGVKDVKWGEVGKAFVTMKQGCSFSETLLREHCANHLAKFKVPRYFEVLDELPKNGSGKIDRKNLA
ncbi:MAG: long-chain fatty acid--CoA ligase [Marinoscillum sp.]|uniref:class I adenylate-forming enzyme family protein n=1 Tax=Marinoscillum sp. TaxID=2024838 RepID=UPI003304367E